MNTKIKDIFIILMVFVGAAGILSVSMSRATLELMMKDENEGRLRVEPVIVQDKVIYKLPQTNMLPNNVFYGIKEIRDWLWLKFSSNEEKKIKILLILADKKIAEAKALAKRGNYDLAFEASEKAVNELKYAKGLIMEIPLQPTTQRQMTIQVRDAAKAYSEIIREISQQDGKNGEKYKLLQQNIDEFKEEKIQ